MIVDLLSRLRDLNVRLWADGERLRYSAPSDVMTPELLEGLAGNKAEIMAFLRKATSAVLPTAMPIPPVDRDGELPLSLAQQRLWFIQQLAPDNVAYNMFVPLRFIGHLEISALEQSLSEILRRHEILRTAFPSKDGHPYQSVESPKFNPLPIVDLQSQPDASGEQLMRQLGDQAARFAFDVDRGPLHRSMLVRLSPGNNVLLFTIHHIVIDGWSLGLLIQEIVELYRAFYEGKPSGLRDLTIQYADFAHWQQEWLNGEVMEEQLNYWKQQLANAPPLLELPTDRLRPAIQRFQGSNRSILLSEDLSASLKELSRSESVTPFVTLLTAFKILLRKYTGQDDIVIGTPISWRPREELNDLIGFFVNTLVLRTDLSSDPSVHETIRRVGRVNIEAQANKDLPFDRLVDATRPKRDLSQNALFQVMFTVHYMQQLEIDLPGLTLQWLEIHPGSSQFDMSLSMGERDQRIWCYVEYSTDLFDEATIIRLLGHFQTLLHAMTCDRNLRLSQLPIMTDAEQHQLLVEWNDTQMVYTRDRLVHHLIEAQVEEAPDAIAVAFDVHHVSYRELNNRTNQLAHYLKSLGVGPETLVGLYADRSLEMVIAILGIVKAGGAYVPLDSSYPVQRLAYMLEDAGVPILLTIGHLPTELTNGASQTLSLDTQWHLIAEMDNANPPCTVVSDNPAYVIYTSGSTGKPKAAVNTHRGLFNRLLWMQAAYGLTGSDRILQKTPFSFDVSVWEFFWPLMIGAKLIVALPGGHKDPTYLAGLICDEGITTIHFVPSMLQAFLEVADDYRCGSLRRVICSGEALPFNLQEHFHRRLGTELHNLYGPTEASIDVTYMHCRREEQYGTVPIGRPIYNTEIFVLDALMQPVPIGVSGELYIAGEGLARGYHERPDLTAEKFLPCPFAECGEQRMYRTGDVARFRPDGNIEFLGRADHQVKIRGFRIELGEIESALALHPSVKEAVVTARDDRSGRKLLVAYFVPISDTGQGSGTGLQTDRLREYLKAKLPDYMVPSIFLLMDELPLTPSGKVDRKALAEPGLGRSELLHTCVTARSRTEEILVDIWSKVLKVEQVSIHDNFFALGGDSISSFQVIARAAKAGLRITLQQMFERQTIASLAEVIGAVPGSSAIQGRVTGEITLTPIQHWFFEQNLIDPHHYNQSVLLEVKRPLDPEFLRKAVGSLIDHHDALRIRFKQSENDWRQYNDGVTEEWPLNVSELQSLSEEEQASMFESEAARLQASLNLTSGPLIQVALFQFGNDKPDRLLVVVHHLVIDGIAWRILLEDLQTCYEQLSSGEPVSLPLKTTSYKEWAHKLKQFAQSERIQRDLTYWLSQPWSLASMLPVDYGRDGNLVESTGTVFSSLDADETHLLLQGATAHYGVRVNDLLLTALAVSFSDLTGGQTLRIDLEHHGRGEIDVEIDVSRTIGWFTSISPVLLKLKGPGQPDRAMLEIKEQLRRIPDDGRSFGILRYLSDDETVVQKLRTIPEAEVSFNYLGHLDQALPESSPFAPCHRSSGLPHSPRQTRKYLIDVIGVVMGGELKLSWVYSKNVHAEETILGLSERYVQALRSLVVCYRSSAEYAITERSESGRDREASNTIIDHLRLNQAVDEAVVEDAYPLSPAQQGMLFHALYAPNSSVYFPQLVSTIYGQLNLSAFRQAWEQIFDRHAILRSSIFWEGLRDPAQVVHKRVALPLEVYDWSELSAMRQEQDLENILKSLREQVLDLRQPPLVRLCLIKLADHRYKFIWCCHHILLDGWSSTLVRKEAAAIYEAINGGRTVHLERPRPYKDYLQWLKRQDPSEAETFWRERLNGFNTPTPLMTKMGERSLPDGEEGYSEQLLELSDSTTEALRSLCRGNRLTLNTLVQGAWALLLSRNSGRDDVVFGVVVAGRPPDLSGVESMVGLFLNTLPMRVRIPSTVPLLDWLSDLQRQQAEMQRHEYSPLVQIQQWSDMPRGQALFESLFAFENYPVDILPSVRDASFEAVVDGSYERTNYPITVMAGVDSKLIIRILYDRRCVDADAASLILRQYETLLEDMAANSDKNTADLSFIHENEISRLIDDFNVNLETF